MANPNIEGKYYEKGFKPRVPVPDVSFYDEAEPGYLEGHNSSPEGKKLPYEAEGAGSTGPAAR